MNGGRAQLPNFSAMQNAWLRTGPLQVKSAGGNDVLTAKAFNAIFVGTAIAATNALIIGLTGRNLIVAVVDANNSETWQFRVTGANQFNEPISEDFPASAPQVGAATKVGSKIFARVDTITPLVLSGDLAAGDNVVVGTGDKVGLPFLLSPDLHELLDIELQVANQATAAAKKAVSAANIDYVYSAMLEAAFAGSVVVAGDNVGFRLRSDCLTPDDTKSYPQKG